VARQSSGHGILFGPNIHDFPAYSRQGRVRATRLGRYKQSRYDCPNEW